MPSHSFLENFSTFRRKTASLVFSLRNTRRPPDFNQTEKMRMTIFERSASDAVDVPAVRPPSHANPMRVCLAAVAGCVLILPACKSGPESKIVVKEHFSIAKAGKRAKQTWAGIEITDLGEPTAVARPVRVQSCRGRYLKFAERKVRGKKGKTRLVNEPFEPWGCADIRGNFSGSDQRPTCRSALAVVVGRVLTSRFY